MPEFEDDWTTHRAKKWAQHLMSYADEPIHLLEIGVHEGRSAIWFIENLLTHPESSYVGIDPYEGWHACKRDRAFSNLKPFSNVEIIQKTSFDALPSLKGQFDIIRVDGCHLSSFALYDIVISWHNLLKEDGILLVDDYGHTGLRDPESVRIAFDGFLRTIMDHQVEILWVDYEIGVKKLASTCESSLKTGLDKLDQKIDADELRRLEISELNQKIKFSKSTSLTLL